MKRKNAITALAVLFTFAGYLNPSFAEEGNASSPATRTQPAKLDRATYPQNSDLLIIKERLSKVVLDAYPEATIEFIGQELVVRYRSEKYQTHITDNGNISKQPADRFPADFSEFILRLTVEQDLMYYRADILRDIRPETFGGTLRQRYNLKEISGIEWSIETSDVPLDHWAYNALYTLIRAGVIDHPLPGQMSGNRAMTRYEFAVAIARSLQYRALNPTAESALADPKLRELLTNLQHEFTPELVRLGLDKELKINADSPKPVVDGQTWQPLYEYLSLRVSYGKGTNPAFLEKIQQVIGDYATTEFNSNSGIAGNYTVNGLPIKITLAPAQPIMMLGEPVALSFVVHNHSDQDFQVIEGGDYRNALGRPESFTVSVTDKNGNSVPQPNVGITMGGILGPKKVPARGSYTFGLFLPHWATFEEPGIYDITARRVLAVSLPGMSGMPDWKTLTKIPVQASTSIEVVPFDNEKMGEVIAALGEMVLKGPSGKAEAASYTLSAIQDERVVPYFAKLLEKRSSDQKFTALRVLGNYTSEDAFQALMRGMQTTGKDIGNTSTVEHAEKLAGMVRHTAAHALAGNTHPRAIPYLLTHRHDPSEAVRLTILHVMGRMKPAAARPLLQEMTRDQSKRVSDEARRYLELLPPTN